MYLYIIADLTWVLYIMDIDRSLDTNPQKKEKLLLFLLRAQTGLSMSTVVFDHITDKCPRICENTVRKYPSFIVKIKAVRLEWRGKGTS